MEKIKLLAVRKNENSEMLGFLDEEYETVDVAKKKALSYCNSELVDEEAFKGLHVYESPFGYALAEDEDAEVQLNVYAVPETLCEEIEKMFQNEKCPEEIKALTTHAIRIFDFNFLGAAPGLNVELRKVQSEII